MKFDLFDDASEDFYPLTLTRPIGDLRIGITKIREKWEAALRGGAGFITSEYLSKRFPSQNSDTIVRAGMNCRAGSGAT